MVNIDNAVKAFESKGYTVKVFDNKEDAAEYLDMAIFLAHRKNLLFNLRYHVCHYSPNNESVILRYHDWLVFFIRRHQH